MKINDNIFNKLEKVDNNNRLRILNDKYLVKKAEISEYRIKALCKKKLAGEPLPEDYKMINKNSCYYKLKKINGYNLKNIKVNDKAFTELLDNGFNLLKEYHQKKIYLCDIHEGNIMYDGKIHFIDYDSVAVNNIFPKDIYQDLFLVFGRMVDRKNIDDLIFNDKLSLLHVMLRIASNCDPDYLVDHTEYELDMLSDDYKMHLYKYMYGFKRIEKDDYLDKEIKQLKKELRKS
jgi:hypothetical protein